MKQKKMVVRKVQRIKVQRKKAQKKQNFFVRHYSLSWDYIKECKNYILFVILVFLLGAVAALFVALTGKPETLINKIIEIISELIGKSKGLDLWEMTVYILDNNLRTSFFAMIFGVLLGIFPVFIALVNGFILGFVSFFAVSSAGPAILWKLVPHGIFELPAVFLSLALGVKFGAFIFAKKKKKEFLRRFEQSLRVFLFVIMPLLIIAAVIEGALINFSDPCNAFDDLNDRNVCYYEKASEQQDSDICRNIEDNLELRDNCYEALGEVPLES